MSRSAPYHGVQVSASTPRRFTARLTLAAMLQNSMKHRCAVQGKIDPPWGPARRRSRLSSQHLPNSACRGSISCIALRCFEASWYLKTLVGLRHRPRCWISSRLRDSFRKSHEDPPSRRLCHHSQLLFDENGLQFAYDLVFIHWSEADVTWTPYRACQGRSIHSRSSLSRITESSKV